MRLLVFTAIFMVVGAVGAVVAAAETPATQTRCVAPGACITVLTSTCNFLVLEKGVITPMTQDDPRLPANIRGFCGFIDPQYYTPLSPPTPPSAYCEGPSCNVTLDNSVNRP